MRRLGIALAVLTAGCPSVVVDSPDVGGAPDAHGSVLDASGPDGVDAASAAKDAALPQVDAGAPPATCMSASPGSPDWSGRALDRPLAGAFEVIWTVTPGAASLDAHVALSQGDSGGVYQAFATAVRFNLQGRIDVLDGRCPQLLAGTCTDGPYRADAEVGFDPGTTYRFRQVVDVSRHSYSVFVGPPGGEVSLAAGYSFRGEQLSVSALDHWTVKSYLGPLEGCLESVSGGESPDAGAPDAGAIAPDASSAPDAAGAPDAASYPDAGATRDAGSIAGDGGPSGPAGAFYGCQGSGCRTRGGFDSNAGTPRVFRVTSLAEGTGAGTLGECIAANGPRVCVFAVAGTINSSGYRVSQPYLTIDGSSAPGGGIQISGANRSLNATYGTLLTVRTHDVVIRGLRLRAVGSGAYDGEERCGGASDWENQGVDDIHHLVFDHNTMQWGRDGIIDLASYGTKPTRETTLSFNVLAEGLGKQKEFYSPLGQYMSRGSLVNGSPASVGLMANIDFHHNFWTTLGHRVPLLGNRSSRFVNNVVYNWGLWGMELKGGVSADIVGNLFKKGPITRRNPIWMATFSEDCCFSTTCDAGDCIDGPPDYYLEGNKYAGDPDPAAGANWTAAGVGLISSDTFGSTGTAPSTYKRSPYQPLPTSSTGVAIATESAGSLTSSVLGSMGAGAGRRLDCGGRFVPNRDVQEVRLFGGFDDVSKTAAQPYTVADVDALGGVPDLLAIINAICPSGERSNAQCRCADDDQDALPDFWEDAVCGGPSVCQPLASTVAPPWTNLEAYLSGAMPAP